jgi:catechol 2,3-dioxygenase-like lactoylglutathione lyase family enzyme
MLGHLGINVPDLAAARRYYDELMPLVGFEPYFHADDEFAYRPADNKPGTYLFFYPAAQPGEYSSQRTGLNTWRSSCGTGRWCTRCMTTSWGLAA